MYSIPGWSPPCFGQAGWAGHTWADWQGFWIRSFPFRNQLPCLMDTPQPVSHRQGAISWTPSETPGSPVLRRSRQEPLLRVTIQSQELPVIRHILQVPFWFEKAFETCGSTCEPNDLYAYIGVFAETTTTNLSPHVLRILIPTRPETLGSNSSRHQRSPESGTDHASLTPA